MIKKSIHIIIVSFLSMLLLFGGTAKEFVHLFAQHEDTIHHNDHVCPPGEAHFEQEHHHCSFLHFVLEPFANDAALIKVHFAAKSLFPIKNATVCAVYIPCKLYKDCSRGPPSVAA